MTQRERVLRYVNRYRAEHDLPTLAELPKGVRHSACDCPIARACGKNTYRDETCAYLAGSDGRYWLPKYVASFIGGFDSGRYPDLVA